MCASRVGSEAERLRGAQAQRRQQREDRWKAKDKGKKEKEATAMVENGLREKRMGVVVDCVYALCVCLFVRVWRGASTRHTLSRNTSADRQFVHETQAQRTQNTEQEKRQKAQRRP